MRSYSRSGLLRYKIAPKCLLPGPFCHSGAGRNPRAVGPVRSYNPVLTYPYQPPPRKGYVFHLGTLELNVSSHSRADLLRYKIAPKYPLSGPFHHSGLRRNPEVAGRFVAMISFLHTLVSPPPDFPSALAPSSPRAPTGKTALNPSPIPPSARPKPSESSRDAPLGVLCVLASDAFNLVLHCIPPRRSPLAQGSRYTSRRKRIRK